MTTLALLFVILLVVASNYLTGVFFYYKGRRDEAREEWLKTERDL